MGEQMFMMNSKVVRHLQSVMSLFKVKDGASQFQNFRVNFHKFHALFSTRLSQLGYAITSESNNSVSVRCSRNVFSFLGDTLILFAGISCSGKTLIEPLPGSGRLCCFPNSIFQLLGIVYQVLLSNGL
jgi:hypothetical protein